MLRDTKLIAMHPQNDEQFLSIGRPQNTGEPAWTENPFIAENIQGYTQHWLDKQAKFLGVSGFRIARARIEVVEAGK